MTYQTMIQELEQVIANTRANNKSKVADYFNDEEKMVPYYDLTTIPSKICPFVDEDIDYVPQERFEEQGNNFIAYVESLIDAIKQDHHYSITHNGIMGHTYWWNHLENCLMAVPTNADGTFDQSEPQYVSEFDEPHDPIEIDAIKKKLALDTYKEWT